MMSYAIYPEELKFTSQCWNSHARQDNGNMSKGRDLIWLYES